MNFGNSVIMQSENAEKLPTAVLESAKSACASLLPAKSRWLYEKTYEFYNWCTEQNITNYTEPVLLAYFSTVVQRALTASLQDIDIGKFNKLIMFIKSQTEGYEPKKSKVLEKEQIQRFISDAPNNLFLMTKVSQ
mgnify:FL=1